MLFGMPMHLTYAKILTHARDHTHMHMITHLLHRGVVVITTTQHSLQLHSTKPELRFCAGLNPAHDVLEIHDGEDL